MNRDIEARAENETDAEALERYRSRRIREIGAGAPLSPNFVLLNDPSDVTDEPADRPG